MTLRDAAKKETVCKNILRIAVFFDGTGNNRFNDIADTADLKARTAKDKKKRQTVQKDQLTPLAKFNKGKTKEYKEDTRSNVSKLYALFVEGKDRDPDKNKIRESYAIYKEGVGTNAGRKDYTSGMGFGNGGAYRINEAIKDVQNFFSTHTEDKWDRQIDVFGFSRGAAQARDFINTFYLQFDKEDYEFKYVGIFDTVGSFGLIGTLSNETNYKPNKPKDPASTKWLDISFTGKRGEHEAPTSLSLDEDYTPYNFNLHNKSAKRILHIKAADEVRHNFPLSDISNTVHPEWTHIGVHSDIGGGYANDFEKHNLDKILVDERVFSYENHDVTNIENYKKEIEREGYYAHIAKWPFHMRIIKYDKRTVRPGLAIIPMQLMIIDAKDYGVPLKDCPDKKNFKIPDKDLEAYYEHSKCSPVDTTYYEHREHILENYVHRSHSISKDLDSWKDRGSMFPRIKGQKASLTAVTKNYQGKEFERNIFANRPYKAVVKSGL